MKTTKEMNVSLVSFTNDKTSMESKRIVLDQSNFSNIITDNNLEFLLEGSEGEVFISRELMEAVVNQALNNYKSGVLNHLNKIKDDIADFSIIFNSNPDSLNKIVDKIRNSL